MEWITRPLGEITSYMAKGIPPKYTEEETENTVRVLNQKCNRNFTISYADSRIHDCTQKKVPSDKLLKKGDVLINSTGTGTAGRVAQMMEIPIPTTIDGHMILLRPSKEMDEFYYGYAVKAHQAQIETLAEGSTGQTEINRNRLQTEVMITYPENKKVQAGIASFLWDIDRKIEANNKINENLQAQVMALFHAMFISSEDRLSWESGTFSDLIESTLGGDWGKESPTGNNTELVYCIRGADIPEVKAGNKGKMPTRYILPKNYAAKRLLPGDIVVEISGGSPTQSTGRVAAISQSLLDRYDKGMVCTNFCRAIKPKSGYSMFVYYYWQYLYDRNVFFSYENGTTGIKNLDLSGFTTTEEIVIPPFELIQKFDDYCQIVFDQTFANGLENEQLSNLRDTLLPRLMSGELDVSEIDI